MTFNDAYLTILSKGFCARLPEWPEGMHLKVIEQEGPNPSHSISVLNVFHGDNDYRWRMPDSDLLSHHWECFVQA